MNAVLTTVLATMAVAGLWIVACSVIERVAAAHAPRRPNRLVNLGCYAPGVLAGAAAGPAVATATVVAVNACGGGWVVLSASGWAIVPSLAVYLVVMDLGEYLFHRAQHRFPVLWAMHSLHHSDTDFNSSTAVRHFWLETLVKSVTIYALAAIILRPAAEVVALYGLLSTYNYFTHMNCRVGFGRWAWLLNSPQYHRIHHSVLPEHYDRNFAALLPVFDVLFGAYSPPPPDLYPNTGLDDGEVKLSWVRALTWPIGRRKRALG